MIFKRLRVPSNNETKEVEAVQMWEVRWQGRHGEFSTSTSPQMEAFTSLEQANEFATSLQNAFRLVRHVGADKITVTKAK